jgi:hypothetical protein
MDLFLYYLNSFTNILLLKPETKYFVEEFYFKTSEQYVECHLVHNAQAKCNSVNLYHYT